MPVVVVIAGSGAFGCGLSIKNTLYTIMITAIRPKPIAWFLSIGYVKWLFIFVFCVGDGGFDKADKKRMRVQNRTF